MSLVQSITVSNLVEISGFELADEASHMISWLGRGEDFPRFVINDVESELYRQTPGAQVLSVLCESSPELLTSATQDQSPEVAMVTGLSVIFPLAIRVMAADGVIWNLNVQHNYVAENIHLNDKRRQLRLDFKIVSSVREFKEVN